MLKLLFNAHLVIAAIVLWNTAYLERVVATLRQREPTLREDLLTHLSPLGWEHISLTGDYVWNPGGGPKRGQFRPLRTIPSTVTP